MSFDCQFNRRYFNTVNEKEQDIFTIESDFSISTEHEHTTESLSTLIRSDNYPYRRKISEFSTSINLSIKAAFRQASPDLSSCKKMIQTFLFGLSNQIYNKYSNFSEIEVYEAVEHSLFCRIYKQLSSLYQRRFKKMDILYNNKIEQLGDAHPYHLGIGENPDEILSDPRFELSPTAMIVGMSPDLRSWSGPDFTAPQLSKSRVKSPPIVMKKEEFCLNYKEPIEIFQSITKYPSPTDKLKCLKHGFVTITKLYNNDTIIGADDLCPLLSYLIIQAKIPDFYSHCQFLSDFITDRLMNMAEGYCLVTLEGIVKYITNLEWVTLPSKDRRLLSYNENKVPIEEHNASSPSSTPSPLASSNETTPTHGFSAPVFFNSFTKKNIKKTPPVRRSLYVTPVTKPINWRENAVSKLISPFSSSKPSTPSTSPYTDRFSTTTRERSKSSPKAFFTKSSSIPK